MRQYFKVAEMGTFSSSFGSLAAYLGTGVHELPFEDIQVGSTLVTAMRQLN